MTSGPLSVECSFNFLIKTSCHVGITNFLRLTQMIKRHPGYRCKIAAMPKPLDSEAARLMSAALGQALDRLRMLGLIDGESNVASEMLSRLIAEAVERGEREQENVILYAMGRFQVRPSATKRAPK